MVRDADILTLAQLPSDLGQREQLAHTGLNQWAWTFCLNPPELITVNLFSCSGREDEHDRNAIKAQNKIEVLCTFLTIWSNLSILNFNLTKVK